MKNLPLIGFMVWHCALILAFGAGRTDVRLQGRSVRIQPVSARQQEINSEVEITGDLLSLPHAEDAMSASPVSRAGIKLLDCSLSSVGWMRALGRDGMGRRPSPLLSPFSTRSSQGKDAALQSDAPLPHRTFFSSGDKMFSESILRSLFLDNPEGTDTTENPILGFDEGEWDSEIDPLTVPSNPAAFWRVADP